MGTLADLLARLDPDPAARGRQFERICKWYLGTDPLYASRLSRVWLWDEWPGRWAPDAGIDLVAKTREGQLWAVQAKAYDERHAIRKADVDTFLSESARPQFSSRLLLATTNQMGARARRTIEGQEKPVQLLLRGELERAAVEWPASPKDLRGRPAPRKRPRPHQREAVRDVLRGFRAADRGQLIMACGTGKTLVGLWTAERLKSRRTLVLVSSLSLLAQTMREWTANARRPFEALPVCSDDTVRGQDHLVSKTVDLPLPATTDPGEIAAFLRKRGPRVVFSTYQSSDKLAEALGQGAPRFHLAIADEAHRCAGPVSSEFAAVLDPGLIRAERRLFMTATPRYFTDRVRQEAQQAEFEVASMDDPGAFGPPFHQLSFGEAIERDLLSDYQVAIVGVDDPTYRAYAERGEFVTTDGERVTDARTLAAQVGLAKAMGRYDLRRTITFHGRIKRAREFSRSVPEVVEWMPADARPRGRLWCEHVSGEMPAGKRDSLLGRFRGLGRGERGVLSNARCLGEGVDVPTLDGVAFIDPRRSQVDIVQAVGRAIRKDPAKKVGTVVLPVFLGDTSDPESALGASVFEPIWGVLKALRSHDEALADELDELRRSLGRAQLVDVRLPRKFRLDLPMWVGEDFVRALRVRLVEQSTASWEFWFGLLTRFLEREGHANPSNNHVEEELKLGRWVSRQRSAFNSGKLDPQRVTRLEALSGWAWDARAAAWEEGFQHLARYVKRQGHARVPKGHLEGGFRLGGWVQLQRHFHTRGRLDCLRIERLESLRGWTWDPFAAAWEEGFQRLARYVKREGHADVSGGHVEDGFRLGGWAKDQRRAYKNGRLDPRRAARLQSLAGWVWEPWEDAWEEGFRRLARFVEGKGHARVPRDHIQRGFRLGDWVASQRHAHNRGSLDPQRIERLESLPEWVWDARAAAWEEGFDHLTQFVEREGHARVPSDHLESGFRLGQWVGVQRHFHKRGNLDPQRADRLKSLPGWVWDPSAAAWEAAFDYLLRFAEREGHASVPYDQQEGGFRLGTWVVLQRQAHKRGKLDPQREARLQAVPGWEWNPRAAAWEEGFRHLLRFAERERHANVPTAHVEGRYELGAWVHEQRRVYTRGRLDPERAGRLQSLPRWAWDALAAAWEEGFERLTLFVEREGHANVPYGHEEDGFKLGRWVTIQQQAFKRGKLDPQRTERLSSLPGWVWDRHAAAWDVGYGHLVHFVEREGHANVPRGHVERDFNLRGWVLEQRRSHSRPGRKLDAQRVKRLESLPGWVWSVKGR